VALAAIILGAVIAPAFSAGRFVCTRGMVQAGPTCPKCRGADTQNANPCCRWIEAAVPTALPASSVTIGAEQQPAPALIPLVSQTLATEGEWRAATDALGSRAGPPLQLSSTILRL